MSTGARDTWIATGTAVLCIAFLAAALACAVVPAATHVDQIIEHDQVTIDGCQEVSRQTYRDAGREAGLAAFDSCVKEVGL